MSLTTHQGQVEHYRSVRQRILDAGIRRAKEAAAMLAWEQEQAQGRARMAAIRAQIAAYVPAPPRRELCIVIEVAERHGLTLTQMRAHRRWKELTAARHEACYELKRQIPSLSYPHVARLVGMNDHTSAIHGVRKHAARHGLPALVPGAEQ